MLVTVPSHSRQPFSSFKTLAGVKRHSQFSASLVAAAALSFLASLNTTLAQEAVAADQQESNQTGVGEIPPAVSRFLSSHCMDCHEGPDGDGGLDLSALTGELEDSSVVRRWVRIHDRVRDGEMPPPDHAELDKKDIAGFLDSSTDWIQQHQRRLHEQFGRARGRRLTNQQLERTLCDLLAIKVPLAELMPDEPRTDGFNNIADGQTMSHFHLETHLKVVDAALDAAFERAGETRRPMKRDFDAPGVARKNPRQRNRDPEMLGGAAVVWSSTLPFYGRISASQVRKDGWYRITVNASALNIPKKLRDDGRGVWCTVRSGMCKSTAPLMYWIGAFEATDEPGEWTFDAWIQKDHLLEIQPGDRTLGRAKFRGGQVGAGEGTSQNVPGLAIHSLKMREIFPGGDQDLVKQRLFGTRDVRYEWKTNSFRFEKEPDESSLTAQVNRFLRRAFRRSVEQSEAQPYIETLQLALQDGQSPAEALRHTYRTILCSPRFLYHYEQPGLLDDHAIAARLSYMMTGSLPDDLLAADADAGKLTDKVTLRRHVNRLLSGPECDQFVRDFTDQWLDLIDIEFTEPDKRMYPEFDIVVQHSMLGETRQFVKSLIRQNEPATALVNASYTFLNSRLARFYDIADVTGDEFQRISLTPDSRRGGLLTHGSILKVTANGTNTSPVLRGVWMCNRLLGKTIPPPPANVPAIEPDIRGTKTIREMLAQHRDNDDCASCHQKIDPPGFALENFDPAGQWRDHYFKRDGRRMKKSAKIDPSYQLDDGREFDSFEEFRTMIASDAEPIARNFAEKLVVYATGAPIEFADRDVIDQIVKQTEKTDFGLRSLVQAVVTSELFLTK